MTFYDAPPPYLIDLPLRPGAAAGAATAPVAYLPVAVATTRALQPITQRLAATLILAMMWVTLLLAIGDVAAGAGAMPPGVAVLLFVLLLQGILVCFLCFLRISPDLNPLLPFEDALSFPDAAANPRY